MRPVETLPARSRDMVRQVSPATAVSEDAVALVYLLLLDALVGDTVRVVDPGGRPLATGSHADLRERMAPALMNPSTPEERVEVLDLLQPPELRGDPALAARIDDLRQWLASFGEAFPLDPERRRQALLEHASADIVQMVREAAPMGCTDPVVVVLDLADPDAERFIPALRERLRSAAASLPPGAVVMSECRIFRRRDALPQSLVPLFPALQTPPPVGVHVVVISRGASLAVIREPTGARDPS